MGLNTALGLEVGNDLLRSGIEAASSRIAI